jgi:hypothetical protein
MITDIAKRKLALFLKQFVTSANIGVGSNATFPSATDLDLPILSTKVGTTNSESDDTTIDFLASFTGSQLQGNTISEFGLFGTVPQDTGFDEMYGGVADPATSGANYASEEIMFTRVNFDAIGPFAASDTIEFILVIEVE